MSSTNAYSTHPGTALVPFSQDDHQLSGISKVAEALTTMSGTCISLAQFVEKNVASIQGVARDVELSKALNEDNEKRITQARLDMHGEYRHLDMEANMRMDKLDARASALADAEWDLSQRKRKFAQDEERLNRAREAFEEEVRAAKQAREDKVADVSIVDAEVVSVCVDASTNTTDTIDNSALPIAPSVVAGPPADSAVAPAAAPLVVGAMPAPVSFAPGDLVLVKFGKKCAAVQKVVVTDFNKNICVVAVTKLNLPNGMGSKVLPDAVQHITPNNSFEVCDLVLSKKNITELYTRYKKFVETMYTTVYTGYSKLEKNEFAKVLTKDTLEVLKPLFSFPDGMRVPRNDTSLVDLVKKLNKAPENEEEADDVEDEVEVEVDAEVKAEIA